MEPRLKLIYIDGNGHKIKREISLFRVTIHFKSFREQIQLYNWEFYLNESDTRATRVSFEQVIRCCSDNSGEHRDYQLDH